MTREKNHFKTYMIWQKNSIHRKVWRCHKAKDRQYNEQKKKDKTLH